MMNRTKLLLILLLIGLTARAADARGLRARAPIPVRITAYVNEKPEGSKPDFDWLVAERKTEYRLYVLKLVVKSSSVMALDIGAAVAPYRIKFQLAGTKDALRTLAAAPPQQPIVIDAYIRFAGGARILMLDKVESAPQATPAATPEQR